MKLKKIALIAGPVLSILLLVFFDLNPGHPEVTRTAAVALLMAVWWMTEEIPLAATALLPIILFPALGIMNGATVSPIYFNYIIFLFIGGFVVALAMQRWNLHKRIALRLLLMFGVHPKGILLGFMVTTAFLSMWISNTATTMMMLPIVLAIIFSLEESVGEKALKKYGIGVLLGVAYSASIGGIATLIGTPPNLSFIRILQINFPNAPEITFANWMFFALPISIVLLLLVWFFLSLIFCPKGDVFKFNSDILKDQYKKLGPVSFEEKVVLIDFILLAVLWIFRADIQIGGFTIRGWSNLFPNPDFFNDGTVAIAMATILFLIPSKQKTQVMDWDTAAKLPWGIVLLFGGGFALATGFKESGLSLWIGSQLQVLSSLHSIVIVIGICLISMFLTELTSNTATAEMILPVVAGLAFILKLNPLLLMIPATLSCSFAFMLPVATPPNAIVFGSGRLHVSDMAKTGIVINFVGIILITCAVYFLGKVVFGIDIAQFPSWAG